jgi:phenylpyruvate tautomerase PptA (4-oxalocrotonate tautomerase family)
MPLVKIHVPAHLADAKARALADAVHSALVATCDVPQADRFQLITRYAETARSIDPVFPNLSRTPDASVVEIALRRGRTDEQKRALYHQTVERAATGGWRADDIMIALAENTLIDWSFGGGVAQYALK